MMQLQRLAKTNFHGLQKKSIWCLQKKVGSSNHDATNNFRMKCSSSSDNNQMQRQANLCCGCVEWLKLLRQGIVPGSGGSNSAFSENVYGHQEPTNAWDLKKNYDTSSSFTKDFLSTSDFLKEDNAVSRVRGAALKLGQMLSIQDNSIISPQLQTIFERVRDSADFMPTRQVEKVMRSEFGDSWAEKFGEFEERPFAAASIGQVHRAILPDGREVALKIQYPGVGKSIGIIFELRDSFSQDDPIDSDINNLVTVLNMGNLIPKGLFLDSFVHVARKELTLECDYLHEATASKKFRQLLADDPTFYVPEVIDELTTKQILTTELIYGIPLDKCVGMPQETRDWLGEKVLTLCLRELFEFNFMQTDPNWSNFFFDQTPSGQPNLILLDFGASRAYGRQFVEKYMQILKAAANGDKNSVLKYSRDIGFLTGYESKVMNDAHCNAVLILGEALGFSGKYNFGDQDITAKIRGIVPVMIEHRLKPPPEEIYSLHRKLSGAFLLCAKLGAKVSCKPLFDKIYDNFVFECSE